MLDAQNNFFACFWESSDVGVGGNAANGVSRDSDRTNLQQLAPCLTITLPAARETSKNQNLYIPVNTTEIEAINLRTSARLPPPFTASAKHWRQVVAVWLAIARNTLSMKYIADLWTRSECEMFYLYIKKRTKPGRLND